jgi:uncharacterized protein (DUF2141 family)
MKGNNVAAVAMLLMLTAQAPKPFLEVVVAGVRTNRGHVLVALCTRSEFLKPHCAYSGRAPAQPGKTVVPIVGAPPGVYAVQAFHDEDDNGAITRNILGLPTEGLGFSRNPPFRFGPPRFDDAAIELGAQGGRVTVSLRRFD